MEISLQKILSFSTFFLLSPPLFSSSSCGFLLSRGGREKKKKKKKKKKRERGAAEAKKSESAEQRERERKRERERERERETRERRETRESARDRVEGKNCRVKEEMTMKLDTKVVGRKAQSICGRGSVCSKAEHVKCRVQPSRKWSIGGGGAASSYTPSNRVLSTHKSQFSVGRREELSHFVRCYSTKDASDNITVLTKAEIPAFIPREDFLQQLFQWAEISVGQRGRSVYGYAMVVEKLHGGEDGEELKGFSVAIGDETTIQVGMDNEVTEKYEFISRGPDGFPVPKGKCEEIKGKYLEVRKVDSNAISENAKQAIRELISQVMKAFDSYYAFGSVFSHDST